MGMDISSAMVATARENRRKAGCAASVGLRAASAEALPFPDDTFDAVVSTGSLHHWKQPLAALNEMHRVLKVDGYALVHDLLRRLPRAVAEAARREFGSLQTRMLWLHSSLEPFYSPRNMEALVPGTSFQRGQTEYVGVLCCLVLRKTTTAPLP